MGSSGCIYIRKNNIKYKIAGISGIYKEYDFLNG